ncbi:hypothetical protein GGF43_000773 [Coemansia sp. RSA 2618]|nr:hypothetical protein GGF43_000773 [Coemansia sp. RSA 2618]
MARKEFPGDPRRTDNIVAYTPPENNSENSMYYLVAFVSSMATLFLKNKPIGWLALLSSLLSTFTDRRSAASTSGSGGVSTITLAFTALLMAYMPEIIVLFRHSRGESAGPVAAQ